MDRKSDKTVKKQKTGLHELELFVMKNQKILLLVLALLLLALPYILNNQYLLTVTVKIGAYAMLALGLNILTGYTGLVSLGHAGFVAVC